MLPRHAPLRDINARLAQLQQLRSAQQGRMTPEQWAEWETLDRRRYFRLQRAA